MEKSDHRQRLLLRARRNRPRCRAAEQRDELAPPHCVNPNPRPLQYSRSQPCTAAKAARSLRPLGYVRFASKADMPSLPPPALCECRHRGLARRRIAARGMTTLIVPECQRPQPGHSCGRGEGLKETTDNDAVRQHIEIVLVPFARLPACRGAF